MEASKTCGVPRLFPELLWQRPTSAGTLGVGVQRSISSKPEVKPQVDLLENKAVAPEFTNLNGWTLKLLAEARKARDWETVWPPHEFWRRFRVKRTQYHIEPHLITAMTRLQFRHPLANGLFKSTFIVPKMWWFVRV